MKKKKKRNAAKIKALKAQIATLEGILAGLIAEASEAMMAGEHKLAAAIMSGAYATAELTHERLECLSFETDEEY